MLGTALFGKYGVRPVVVLILTAGSAWHACVAWPGVLVVATCWDAFMQKQAVI